MDYTPFIEMCKAAPEKEYRWADSFCSTLDGIFDDEMYQDTKKVCSLFYGQSNGLSKAQFYRKQKYVIKLYTWLYEQGKVTRQFLDYVTGLRLENVVSETELNVYFFKNMDSVLGFIKLVGSQHGLASDGDLLMIKAIAILAWNSVSVNEMCQLKKRDLNRNDRTVQIRGDRERRFLLEDRDFNILQMFADQTVHTGLRGVREYRYLSSPYLFRSSRQTSLTQNNINLYLKSFNEEAKKFGHVLSLPALKKNGAFCKVLPYDDGKRTVNLLLAQKCGIDRQVAFGYAKIYQSWKAKYHIIRLDL